jgi:hypothetical protein
VVPAAAPADGDPESPPVFVAEAINEADKDVIADAERIDADDDTVVHADAEAETATLRDMLWEFVIVTLTLRVSVAEEDGDSEVVILNKEMVIIKRRTRILYLNHQHNCARSNDAPPRRPPSLRQACHSGCMLSPGNECVAGAWRRQSGKSETSIPLESQFAPIRLVTHFAAALIHECIQRVTLSIDGARAAWRGVWVLRGVLLGLRPWAAAGGLRRAHCG